MITKIAVDLHGFLDSYYPVTEAVLIFWKSVESKKVYVLSGPEKVQIEEELTKLGYFQGVHYDEIFSIVDFLKESKDPDLHQDEKGHWWTTTQKWFSSKGKFCKKEGIDVIFDDKGEYWDFMSPSTKKLIVFIRIEKEKK